MTNQMEIVLRAIVSELERLPHEKIVEVLDFARFLRTNLQYPYPQHPAHRVVDETKVAQLYAEAASDDLELAESGLGDYRAALQGEDADAKR